VDRARSRTTGGSGLGLAIVKHIATDHGGEVTAWSMPGQGSTFTLRLPEMGRTETITVGSRTLEVSANPRAASAHGASVPAPGRGTSVPASGRGDGTASRPAAGRPAPADRPSGKGD
jgi:two-component system sensor histidine kinase SenX3